MKPQNDLDALALKYGSDKFGSHFYTSHYHESFFRLRDKPIHLLEIGIGGYQDPNNGGASLRMWQEYFPQAHIYGLDYFPKELHRDDRISTYQGSQADPVAIAKMLVNVPTGRFDIVIDDGSHRSEHIIASFLMLFPYVSDDGWYVIEDTQTSYWPDYGGHSYNEDASLTTVSFFKNFIHGLNWREMHRPGYLPTIYDQNILSIQFFHNMIFIRKGKNIEESNFVRENRIAYAT